VRTLLVLLTAASVTVLVVPAVADSGRGGEGGGHKTVNDIARDDKRNIKDINNEDDYYSAVDEVAHFGVVGIELESQGYDIDWDHLDKKWDKNWERLAREYDKLNR
jgi:hypothetical protein